MLDLLKSKVAEADGAAVFLDDVYEIKSAFMCQAIHKLQAWTLFVLRETGLHRTFSLGSCPELSPILSSTFNSF